MGVCRNLCWVLLNLHLFLIRLSCLLNAQPFDYPMANLSTSWINSPSALHSVDFTDRSTVRPILLRGSNGPRYACGFFCNGNCNTYLFAIFIVQTNSGSGITSPASGFPQVVWSANRNNLVRINATLELTSDGDLVLRDVDGTLAWSTNTTGKSVAGLNLTDVGNLVLFDINNAIVWQSFDYPTDSLVPGQKLVEGQKLTASVSATNWTQQGLFSFSVTGEGLFAFIESNPPQFYYEHIYEDSLTKESKEPNFARFSNGSLGWYTGSAQQSETYGLIDIPLALPAQYMRLGPDGHLKVYEWGTEWNEVADLLSDYLDVCDYPMVCGKYGICLDGQCSCPASTGGQTIYFKQINDRQPDLGCYEITPLSCGGSEYHSFVELQDIAYFTFNSNVLAQEYREFYTTTTNSTYITVNIPTNNSIFPYSDPESCKQACSKNCSCKAAIFLNAYDGLCYLASQLFSLINYEREKNMNSSTAYVKVQNVASSVIPHAPLAKKTGKVAIILGSSLGAFFGLSIIIGILILLFLKKKDAHEPEEEYLDQLPGLPTRFSYEDLKAMTENFTKKLGEGGFGSVFEGILIDDTKIAVKRLDGLGHIKKSFLAEVETIGSIHHVNLVRLIGFCAEKCQRLLVYEYMSNGSLEKWIFCKTPELVLDWQQRRKIINDIAKGLTYLHEDCRHKIIHLDIKPQNILLDEKFSAKISDFGLSKLIDRDQMQVVTTMRGTPGYMAPEWLNAVITEKVDVYSFGVLTLEILCGRKHFDRSLPDEDMHLLSLLKKKAEEGQLLDIVDKYSNNMQLHRAEVENMIQVAAWCLQSDYAKRPSMSMVVKVLEGIMNVEHNVEYNFSNGPISKPTPRVNGQELDLPDCTALLPSILSGPR